MRKSPALILLFFSCSVSYYGRVVQAVKCKPIEEYYESAIGSCQPCKTVCQTLDGSSCQQLCHEYRKRAKAALTATTARTTSTTNRPEPTCPTCPEPTCPEPNCPELKSTESNCPSESNTKWTIAGCGIVMFVAGVISALAAVVGLSKGKTMPETYYGTAGMILSLRQTGDQGTTQEQEKIPLQGKGDRRPEEEEPTDEPGHAGKSICVSIPLEVYGYGDTRPEEEEPTDEPGHADKRAEQQRTDTNERQVSDVEPGERVPLTESSSKSEEAMANKTRQEIYSEMTLYLDSAAVADFKRRMKNAVRDGDYLPAGVVEECQYPSDILAQLKTKGQIKINEDEVELSVLTTILKRMNEIEFMERIKKFQEEMEKAALNPADREMEKRRNSPSENVQ